MGCGKRWLSYPVSAEMFCPIPAIFCPKLLKGRFLYRSNFLQQACNTSRRDVCGFRPPAWCWGDMFRPNTGRRDYRSCIAILLKCTISILQGIMRVAHTEAAEGERSRRLRRFVRCPKSPCAGGEAFRMVKQQFMRCRARSRTFENDQFSPKFTPASTPLRAWFCQCL